MKFNHPRQTYLVGVLLFLSLLGLIIFVLPARGNDQPQTIAGLEGTPFYFPIIRKDPTPTPTFTPTPVPIPQFVSNIPTDNAKCPGAAGFNPIGGHVYILNEYSSNVNVFHNRIWGGTVTIPPTWPDDPAGSWPIAIAADNDSADVYVAAIHAGTARINGANLVGMGERYYEPRGVAINPVNGYTYVPDLDRAMQVFNGTTLVQNIVFAMDPTWDAWFIDAVVDPNTGYVYTAGVEGVMYVVDGTTVIGSYRLGWRVIDLAIDPVRGYIYAAHSGKNAQYQNNISVFNINTQTVTPLNTADHSRSIAVDPNTGLTYVTNPGPGDDPANDSITLLTGTVVHGNVTVGNMPWGVAVNPNTRHAFVTNRGDNTVMVFRDGAHLTTIPVQGRDPYAVAVDTNNNDIYIANRGREYITPWGQCDLASVTILH
ncbi:MAG TPA: hypothetical protein PLD25_22225 [Chloroflexota bacterium]|nr:hypothetical protein [Chloroflexota bacterium]HUM71011.1 hypothetical protein [Chloroflexota bacterium]